jgi:histidinol phosphatase-like PHP family hydrolase
MNEHMDENDSKVTVNVDSDQMKNLLKKYKKVKKYMRSNLYEVKKLDGTEKVVSQLLKDSNF